VNSEYWTLKSRPTDTDLIIYTLLFFHLHFMSLFSPLISAVIVGASTDPKKIGNILLAKNTGFQGRLYGINPK
jgi:hypothetical protein